jgi:hypothetical protein
MYEEQREGNGPGYRVRLRSEEEALKGAIP